jgi:hypothetical protein
MPALLGKSEKNDNSPNHLFANPIKEFPAENAMTPDFK